MTNDYSSHERARDRRKSTVSRTFCLCSASLLERERRNESILDESTTVTTKEQSQQDLCVLGHQRAKRKIKQQQRRLQKEKQKHASQKEKRRRDGGSRSDAGRSFRSREEHAFHGIWYVVVEFVKVLHAASSTHTCSCTLLLVGLPNVGKSTLTNLLAGASHAEGKRIFR